MEMLVVSLFLMATLEGVPASVVGTSTTEKIDLSFFDNLDSETSNPVHMITPVTAAPPAVPKPTASPFFGVPSQGSRGSLPTGAFVQSESPSNPLSQLRQFPFLPSLPQFSYENFVPHATGGFSSKHPSSGPSSAVSPVSLFSSSPHTSSASRPPAFWPSFHSQISQPNTLSSANLYPPASSFYSPVGSLPPSVSGLSHTGNFFSHSTPFHSLPPQSLSIPLTQEINPLLPLSSAHLSSHLSSPVAPSFINTYAPSHPLVSSEALPSPSVGTPAPVVATFIRSYVPPNQFSHLPFLPPSQPSVSYSPYGLNPSYLTWNDIPSAIVNSYVSSSPIVSSISRNRAVPHVSAPSYSYPRSPYSSVPTANMVSGTRSYSPTPVQPSLSFISSASPAYSTKSHNSQPSFSTLGYMPSSSTKNLLYPFNKYPLQFNTI